MAKHKTGPVCYYKGKGLLEAIQHKFKGPARRTAVGILKAITKRGMKGKGIGPIPQWVKDHNIEYASLRRTKGRGLGPIPQWVKDHNIKWA
jgi:hypothetical protein